MNADLTNATDVPRRSLRPNAVIPAKAGIQPIPKRSLMGLDSRLRGNDGLGCSARPGSRVRSVSDGSVLNGVGGRRGVNEALFEHIDGLWSGFAKPMAARAEGDDMATDV